MPPKKVATTTDAAADLVAKKYRKLEHREHVLQKPGMYIGSIETDSIEVWLMNQEGTQMVKRKIGYIPGLFKIFDEIVGNAIDHSIKQLGQENPVKNIKVEIDSDTGVITVTNDGDGIEIVKHPDHGIYVPELIFGNLLTSTNYDEEEERVVQGTNGIGCKACNIFSKWFVLETVDATRSLKYKQRFEDNMSVIKAPSVTKFSKKPYTSVTFLPDYEKFGQVELTNDMYEVMRKRVYDACAVTGKEVSISFNGQKILIPSFEKYVDLYIGSKSDHTRVHELVNDKWEIVASYNDFGGFEQISFVNGVLTLKGGKHVDYIVNQIVKKVTELITKKHKEANIRPQTVKDNLILFIKSSIVNPAFDSQTKETLVTPVSKFGSKAELSAAFITKLFKSGIEQKIMDISAIHDGKALKKTDGKKSSTVRGIVKLEDASWAGGAKSDQCVLILTEGDSAATMAIAGLVEVGRERYGVFPLKGKVMNVKDATVKKISENEEINNLKKILGLENGKAYKGIEDLRYGKVMLMTDADSVTGDTPMVCRKGNKIYIMTIDEVAMTDWIMSTNGKEYAEAYIDVWTERGWTPIKHVMRHKTSKRIYRVITSMGCVDVTEDHSLLDLDANKIRPSECVVGQELLHHPFDKEEIMCYDTIDVDKAYLLGETWDHTRVPDAILYGSNQVRNSWLSGVGWLNGISSTTKIGAMELYYMVTAGLGNNHLATIMVTGDQYTVVVKTPTNQSIIDIIDLGICNQYVYDLETENHHFHAGVGSLIVHNTDGSHIKGLIFNLFHSLWPTLVRDPASSFMTSLLTPIIKAKRRDETLSFYTQTDFEKWYTNNQTGWKIKYYKGLGTSTNAEAREYFKSMRQVTYKFNGETSDESMNLAFNKKLADERKTWLSHYQKNDILDYTETNVTYEKFVNKELIHFSNYDLERSLPSMCDGLKISQRKIMFACFKRNLVSEEIKVAQLSGYVSEVSSYHHGEVSLQQAIVNLAQDYMGSNNMNLLSPNGQFGSRNHQGRDASSPRYIFTLLAPTTPLLFPKEDMAVLTYLVDDGDSVEPEYYVPILPTILINGALGIGTGFSTNIPCYNPADIIKVIKGSLAQGADTLTSTLEIHPWYRGFIGEIKEVSAGKYVSLGKWTKASATSVRITELPVGTGTHDYKEDLEALLDKEPSFKKYENKSAEKIDITLHFASAMALATYMEVEENGYTKLENMFKLVSSKGLSTTNMYAFNPQGQITKYNTPLDIMTEFYKLRLTYYTKRKEAQIAALESSALVLENKRRFIKGVVSAEIKVTTMKKADLETFLGVQKPPFYKHNGSYDYLVNIPIYNLTKDKVDELEADVAAAKGLINKLKGKTVHSLWQDDLTALEKKMEKKTGSV